MNRCQTSAGIRAGMLAFGILIALGTKASAGGLTLREAMRAATQNSEEARLLDEKDTRQHYVKREVWAGALPSVQGYANAGRGASPFDPNAFFRDTTGKAPSVINFVQNRYSYGLEVTQSIYSFGRLGQAFKVAGFRDQALAAEKTRALQELQLRSLDAFYGAVTTAARLSTLEGSLKRQKETVAFLESNFRMGSGMRAGVMLAVASLKGLEPERLRAERDAEAARMACNRILGRPVGDALDLDTADIPDFSLPAGVSDSQWVEKAQADRPDLQSLSLQRDALRGMAKAVYMQYRPSFGFQGKAGILAYRVNEQLADFDKNLEWQVGVGLQWNLFDGLATASRAQQYASDARSLELNEKLVRQMARIEIETALREAAAADTAFQAAGQARDASAEAQKLMSEDFRAGKGQVTDLLAAEEGLRNAEFGVLAARYQRVRSRAALRVALGMDLIEEVGK